ncbi:hypothetical protein JTB14_011039 [Gonioctena quinquepunctata]|nr:hypothetical protein JTB14_011039 [Gonioctena quinquepunctata]
MLISEAIQKVGSLQVDRYVIKYAGEAISWGSKLQATVALSTAEAELISACEATKELLWIRQLSLEIDSNGEALTRTKHIDIKVHFIKEKNGNQLKVFHIQGENQLADIFIKPLPSPKFQRLWNELGK